MRGEGTGTTRKKSEETHGGRKTKTFTKIIFVLLNPQALPDGSRQGAPSPSWRPPSVAGGGSG